MSTSNGIAEYEQTLFQQKLNSAKHSYRKLITKDEPLTPLRSAQFIDKFYSAMMQVSLSNAEEARKILDHVNPELVGFRKDAYEKMVKKTQQLHFNLRDKNSM